jgi:surface polysaccharide O-acyltransferase-like enzyme
MGRTSLAFANLRALTILLVVSFHSVLAYLGSQPATQPPFDAPPYSWRAFPILDHERWFGFDLYCALLYVFLMPLFFFISGLFVWPSLSRKDVKAFLSGRAWRIGLPFLLGAAFLMPLAHYPVYRVTAADPSWPAFWAHWIALPYWSVGPLWFLWQLLALNIAAAALYWLAPGFGGFACRLQSKAAERPGRYLLGFGAISVVAYLPLASIFKPWEWSQIGPLSVQSAQVPLFIVYFFAGVAVGANGVERGLLDADGMLARRWRLWLGLATAAFFAWLGVTALTVESKTPLVAVERLASVLYAVSSVTACAALIAVFLRFATRAVPVSDSLARNAYGIYLVHYLFVVWLQYLMLGVGLLAVAKGLFVSAASLLLSWGTAIAFGFWAAGRTSFTRRGAGAAAAIAAQPPSNEATLPDKL